MPFPEDLFLESKGHPRVWEDTAVDTRNAVMIDYWHSRFSYSILYSLGCFCFSWGLGSFLRITTETASIIHALAETEYTCMRLQKCWTTTIFIVFPLVHASPKFDTNGYKIQPSNFTEILYTRAFSNTWKIYKELRDDVDAMDALSVCWPMECWCCCLDLVIILFSRSFLHFVLRLINHTLTWWWLGMREHERKKKGDTSLDMCAGLTRRFSFS